MTAWFCIIIALGLTLFGANVEGAIWMLIAMLRFCSEDIIRAINKGDR